MAGLAVAAAGAVVAVLGHRYGFSGLALDRAAVLSWLAGDGLYAYRDPLTHLGAALPPVAALAVLPAAALPLAVTRKLAARGAVGPDEVVVAVVTSSGLKDPEATAARLPEIPLIEPTFAALQRVLDAA